MDISYATSPMFGGEIRRLYREVQLPYIISDPENSYNHLFFPMEKFVILLAIGNKITFL